MESLRKKFKESIHDFQNDFYRIITEYDLLIEVKVLVGLSEEKIIHIFKRFHIVTNTISKRYRDRETLIVNDEKDVQDLLHALLKINFDDVRPEEPTESKAGHFSIIDFLLKKEKIGIEAKMARKGHGNLQIKKELTLDKDYYRKHSKCKKLLCLVYDPQFIINNPRGFENDLSDDISGLETKVFIVPN